MIFTSFFFSKTFSYTKKHNWDTARGKEIEREREGETQKQRSRQWFFSLLHTVIFGFYSNLHICGFPKFSFYIKLSLDYFYPTTRVAKHHFNRVFVKQNCVSISNFLRYFNFPRNSARTYFFFWFFFFGNVCSIFSCSNK